MKSTITKITMAMVIAATVAGEARVYGPGEYRPIRSAMMDVIDASGPFQNASDVSITMAKQDTDRKPTRLVLSYVMDAGERDLQPGESIPVNQNFQIVSVEDIGCGSVQYIAEERLPIIGRPSQYRELGSELILTDHTNRTCHDVLLGIWEAKVSRYAGAGVFELSLRGNPRPVYTPQSIPSIQTINNVFDKDLPLDVRPIRNLLAGMIKKSATQKFKNVQDVKLAMLSFEADMSNPFGLTLSYVRPETGETVVEELSITDRRELECGSVQYVAQLMTPQLMYLPVDSNDIQRRLSVVLIDHTNLTCRIHQMPFTWEASVREGYGFCGTFDATMELGGNPEFPFKLQN